MANIPLSSIIGSNDFVAETFDSVIIPSGQSADYIIPCPSGKKIKVTNLVSSFEQQENISVSMGTRLIVDDYRLQDSGYGFSFAANEFVIGNDTLRGGNCDFIIGNNNEDLTISFGTTTSGTINLSYQVGS